MDAHQAKDVKSSICTNFGTHLLIAAWKTDAQFTKYLNGLVTMIYP
jgi:hypothetical protein